MEGGDQWVEWAYAFDVHLNGFFSLMVMLHGVQLVLVGECACGRVTVLVGG